MEIVFKCCTYLDAITKTCFTQSPPTSDNFTYCNSFDKDEKVKTNGEVLISFWKVEKVFQETKQTNTLSMTRLLAHSLARSLTHTNFHAYRLLLVIRTEDKVYF